MDRRDIDLLLFGALAFMIMASVCDDDRPVVTAWLALGLLRWLP